MAQSVVSAAARDVFIGTVEGPGNTVEAEKVCVG